MKISVELADLISSISLICSIGLTVFNFRISRQLNRINLTSSIFNELFFNILFKELPEFLKGLSTWDKNKLDDLDTYILNLKEKLDTYRYVNKKFVKKVMDILYQLDEYNVNLGRDNISHKDIVILKDKIEEMYSIFLKEYRG